jgi:hypothetical protein
MDVCTRRKNALLKITVLLSGLEETYPCTDQREEQDLLLAMLKSVAKLYEKNLQESRVLAADNAD